jgi:hypothetical protein
VGGLEELSREELISLVLAQAEALKELESLVEGLRGEVAELKRQRGQNSGNSSWPSSTDKFSGPAPKSLRGRSGRRPGKQPGAPGAALELVGDPDDTFHHYPDVCRSCQAPLADAAEAGVVRRQVHDLPEPRVQVIEHQLHKRRCRGCGTVTAAGAPEGVAANVPVAYGGGLRALAVYLVVFQLIPIGRTAELISNLCGASVSTGWITTVLDQAHDKLEDIEQLIKTLITLSYVVHADETGIKVAENTSRKGWLHVASTTLLTSYFTHSSRGLAAVWGHGVLPGFTGVLVHDSLGMYDSAKLAADGRAPVFDHQLCGAHLCRELVAAAETHPGQRWPEQAKDALEALNSAAHAARDAGLDHIPPELADPHLTLFRHAVRIGLADHPRRHGQRKQTKTRNLLERLRDRDDDILRFTRDLRVPFTNNRAEGDLRMSKTQVKVSGTMRTAHGAARFARIRGYISTCRKNGIDALTALNGVFNGNPWTPGLIHAT